MSIPNTYNPSDYEYLLKSLIEGNIIAKSQSLKRFNSLVITDKKQFSIYAKRVILSIQQLMFQQKEDINLLASMLVLEIINLNPKEIEYYIRTKLLKHVVTNLGDSKPQLRKTSHYCLLAYIKTYKSFDEIINVYIQVGINSNEAQLRQKSINSFQSILITEVKLVNWNSPEFKKIFELLLKKLKDQSQYVQKAAQQCLLTISKMEEIKPFSKKLSSAAYAIFKMFCDSQIEMGNLESENVETTEKVFVQHKSISLTPSQANKISQKVNNNQLTHQKSQLNRHDSLNKKAIIDRIEQIRRNSQTPKIDQNTVKSFPKAEEPSIQLKKDSQRSLSQHNLRENKRPETPVLIRQKQLELQMVKQIEGTSPMKLIASIAYISKSQKVENIFGKKLLEDLKNQKDWKVRLQAIQQLQMKFEMYKQAFDIESLMKNFVPTLIKLLADQNFKIALISLKIIQMILKIEDIKLESIVPQIIEKLNDNKIALRQNVSKLIRSEYLSTGDNVWIDLLLQNLKKSTSNNTREETLNILTKLYEQKPLQYSYQKIVDQISPLMDDLKTKIKIRTLDLLVLVTIKTKKVDNIKSHLMTKMNQVYYQMYLQKVTKQLKNQKFQIMADQNFNFQKKSKISQKQQKSLAFPSLKSSKISPNNTTSTSLQKYKRNSDSRQLNRVASFVQKQRKTQNLFHTENISLKGTNSQSHRSLQKFQAQNLSEISVSRLATDKFLEQKIIAKPTKKKVQRLLQSKLSTSFATQSQNLKPVADPQKQLKIISQNIKSDEWQKASDSLTKLRRIIRFHSNYLTPLIGKAFVNDIMKHVESLRSSLSKNAVITINDLSSFLKRHLDTELDFIFTKLIKKTLDTNSFISEQVKKALISISTNSNEAKVVNLLVSFHNSRAIPIKQSILYILQQFAFLPRVYDKEIQKIISILADFMEQGSLQIREKTKIILINIIQKQNSNRIYKLIPSNILQKLNRKVQTKEETPVKINTDDGAAISKKKMKQKILIFPNEFVEIEELIIKCQNNDWKNKVQFMTEIINIYKRYPEEACQHRMASKTIDLLSKQASDSNTKVSINSFNLLLEIAQRMPILIQKNIIVVLNQIFNCFSAQKAEIRQLASALFDKISSNIEQWILIQHICNGALYGLPKSRPTILFKLLRILSESYKQKPLLIQKFVFGMINKIADQSKPQLMPILKQIINMCLNLDRNQTLLSLKQNAKNLINE